MFQTLLLVITIFVSLILILLYYYLYKWVVELEKQGCECSDMWQREFVTYGTPIIIAMSVLSLFLNVMLKMDVVNKDALDRYTKENMSWGMPIYFLYVVFGFVYIIVLFDFTKKLKELECQCSDAWIREFGYMYSLIMVILWSVTLGLTVLLGLIGVIGLKGFDMSGVEKKATSTKSTKQNKSTKRK